MADNVSVAAALTAEPASDAAVVRAENRVNGLDLFSLPRIGLDVPFSPDCIWDFPLDVRRIASAPCFDPTTAQFLTRDPAVATTRSPYAYVGGNPLNATDPSGMIDQSFLSLQQIVQINEQCAGWQNQSMCAQAAFCAEWTSGLGSMSGGSCHEIGQIAADNYNVVQDALCASEGGDVNINGYVKSQAAAQRDLAEMQSAFSAANEGIAYANANNTCRANLAATAVGVLGVGALVIVSGIGAAGVVIIGRGVAQGARNGGPSATQAVATGVAGAALSTMAACGG